MTTRDDAHGKIVVGVDGSPSSSRALCWAARQAQLTGSPLHAVIAWHWPPTLGAVGQRVAAHARCPVVVVPGPAHDVPS